MVLAISSRATPTTVDAGARDNFDNSGLETRDSSADNETMVSSYEGVSKQSQVLSSYRFNRKREKQLRFRTRTFAAECLRHLLKAVGDAPAHFDLSLAREATSNNKDATDWLVLHVHELVSLAYQICTIQLESMQPTGIEIMSGILDKFEMIEDPELLGHLLLEQYQAQLVSACRTALDISSGPILLEAGLRLATKILTSGIIRGDQASVKRIFTLISRPLDDFRDLYYPSFAEWVSCKIKIRLLVAHASLKCYSYTFLKNQHETSNEYSGLLPLFSKSSSVLGEYWMRFLRDYIRICFGMQHDRTWMPFLDGMQSPLASGKLMVCLEEAWPVIFQAVALDAYPTKNSEPGFSNEICYDTTTLSGYNMVALDHGDFQLIWSFALLVLFQWQHPIHVEHTMPVLGFVRFCKGSLGKEINLPAMKVHEIVLPVLQFLSTKNFFKNGFLSINVCQELLKMLTYFFDMDDSWHSLSIPLFLQIVQNCPDEFLTTQSVVNPVIELCVAYLFKAKKETDTSHGRENWNDLLILLFSVAKALSTRLEPERQLRSLLLFLCIGHECCREAAAESIFSAAREFVSHLNCLYQSITVSGKIEEVDRRLAKSILGGCMSMTKKLITGCIESIYTTVARIPKLLQMKLAFYLELAISYTEFAYQLGLSEVEGMDLFVESCLKHSVSVFETTLTDSNIQVRAIALHILYSVAQKGSTSKSFYLFYLCELCGPLFRVLLAMLKKPVAKEKMAIVGECVRVLVLLHSLSKDTKCEYVLINLLLEGIHYVLAASEDDFSPEMVDVRNLSVKIVTHLAQLPSSAAIFKDALLALPVDRRQQLQVIIRASVTNNKDTTQLVSTTTPLTIRLPVQSAESNVHAVTYPSDKSDADEGKEIEEEDDGDDDDDWDAFQSFPASATTADSYEESVVPRTKPDDSDDALEPSPALMPPKKDPEIESTDEPTQINNINSDNGIAMNSPNSDADAKFNEEEPIPTEYINSDDSEVLLASPAAATTNVHAEAGGFDSVESTPDDDSKIDCDQALQSSSHSVGSKIEPEPADDFKEDDNVATVSSPTALTPEIDLKAGADTEEASSDSIKSDCGEAHQSSLSILTAGIESEAEINKEKTTTFEDSANDIPEKYTKSSPLDNYITEVTDEKPHTASNVLVLPESPGCSSVDPDAQDSNEASGINHQNQDSQASAEQ